MQNKATNGYKEKRTPFITKDFNSLEHYLSTLRQGLEREGSPRSAAMLGMLDYIIKNAYRVCRNQQDMQDYIQTALLYVLRAYELFQPEKGNKFITYATNWMLKGLNETTRKLIMVPMSMHDMEHRASINKLASAFEKEKGRLPDMPELMQLIQTKGGAGIRKLTRRQVQYLLFYQADTLSLDAPAVPDPDSPTLGDTVPDPRLM